MTPTADGFFVFPPVRGAGALWLARTVGGIHDPNPTSASGPTQDEALQLARALLRCPALR